MARKGAEVSVRTIKAIGDGISQAVPSDMWQNTGLYQQGVLPPPYDPKQMIDMVQSSSILPQCISAMVQNIHGFGYTLTPDPALVPGENGEYAADVVAERDRLEFFFSYGHPDYRWDTHRRQLWWDVEATGNGYLEVLRDGAGIVSGWEKIDPQDMRLARMDPDPTPVDMKVLDGTEYQSVTYHKRFRRFVQLVTGRSTAFGSSSNAMVWFKEFGDPRAISAEDGRVLSEDDIGKGKRQATEILHFRVYAPGTPYGIPRWIGTTPSVLGSRAADEVNFSFFDNKCTPPFFVLVSGGTLSDKSVQRINDAITQAKGRDKFHSAVVLETSATPAPATPGYKQTAIEIKEMSVHNDGLWQEFDANSRAKVRSSFRLPPLFAGESQDYSHATAQASQEVAEAQVFAPERDAFDETINRRIMPELDAKYWHFKTNASKETDPADRAALLVALSTGGALTAGELRQEAEQILGRELEPLDNAPWLDMPVTVFLASLKQQAAEAQAAAQAEAAAQQEAGGPDDAQNAPGGPQGVTKGNGVGDLIRMLVAVRKGVLEAEASGDLDTERGTDP